MMSASRRRAPAARKPRYTYVGPAEAVTVCPLRGRRDYEGPCGDGSCPGMIRGRCMFVNGEPVRAAEGMFVEGRCPIVGRHTVELYCDVEHAAGATLPEGSRL